MQPPLFPWPRLVESSVIVMAKAAKPRGRQTKMKAPKQNVFASRGPAITLPQETEESEEQQQEAAESSEQQHQEAAEPSEQQQQQQQQQ